MNPYSFTVSDPVLLALLATSGYTDIRYQKIYNAFTLPALALGLILNTAFFGFAGARSSAIGFLVGFGIFFLIYLWGGIGGGDVKLAGAIGAIAGYPFIVPALFYSILIGGAMALIELVWRKRLFRSLKNIFITVFTFFLPGTAAIPLDPAESLKVPYGFAIAAGTLWAWVEAHFFNRFLIL
ncbi:MAG: A24 family peptidase [Proteobacteria bacterium]|nr:A24 family peptidase [Pseudomonadota bacterium]